MLLHQVVVRSGYFVLLHQVISTSFNSGAQYPTVVPSLLNCSLLCGLQSRPFYVG